VIFKEPEGLPSVPKNRIAGPLGRIAAFDLGRCRQPLRAALAP